jgi:hypothetical protein
MITCVCLPLPIYPFLAVFRDRVAVSCQQPRLHATRSCHQQGRGRGRGRIGLPALRRAYLPPPRWHHAWVKTHPCSWWSQGPHAADGSFAQMFYFYGGARWNGGVNVSITWGTQPPAVADSKHGLASLRLSIETVDCGNCSDWSIVLLPGFVSELWGRVGRVAVVYDDDDDDDDGDAQPRGAAPSITFAPMGDLPATTLSCQGAALPAGSHANLRCGVRCVLLDGRFG